ncbi:FAD-dependent oxidoreductase [Trinickia soli]|uniref:FAD-dependent oxidoreductase n=1 Tax=Trinickia soli TaxID=380675 RepID=A0A2N7VYT3_9BURK|nr:FAD-dependent oxidoreductase [Trinickia soli]PMS22314.1 FAD-dependent oxidoreductase [Trinickia soli]CAB3704940.1 D-amino acid dehydrogenase [Trinickia soli]
MTAHSSVVSPTIPSTPDFAVLGGGLCGRLVAWRLAGAGHSVALYDRGDPAGSSSAAWVAAAMLAPLAEAAVAEPLIVGLGATSLEEWPTVLAALPEPVFFQRNGTLVVWHHADRSEASLFERRVRANAPAQLLADGGLVGVDGNTLALAEPALAGRFATGWLLPREGQLDNRQVLRALAAGLAARGVATHWNTTIDDAALPSARVTIDCRGLGAKPVMPVLRGIRGEVARVQAPGIGLTRPVRLLHPRYPLYVAPKQDDVYVIGATEIEGEDMSPVSVRSALELLSAAFAVHPGFGEARILELNTQCRPTLPDHLPAVMWDGVNTLRVNGLYRHGYMIAPEVSKTAAELACALLAGQVTDFDGFAALRKASPWAPMLHCTAPHELASASQS